MLSFGYIEEAFVLLKGWYRFTVFLFFEIKEPKAKLELWKEAFYPETTLFDRTIAYPHGSGYSHILFDRSWCWRPEKQVKAPSCPFKDVSVIFIFRVTRQRNVIILLALVCSTRPLWLCDVRPCASNQRLYLLSWRAGASVLQTSCFPSLWPHGANAHWLRRPSRISNQLKRSVSVKRRRLTGRRNGRFKRARSREIYGRTDATQDIGYRFHMFLTETTRSMIQPGDILIVGWRRITASSNGDRGHFLDSALYLFVYSFVLTTTHEIAK